MARGIVLCTSSHPISLHPDGITIGPREWAEDIDLDDSVNAQAILDGHLTVLTKTPTSSPRTKSGEVEQPTPVTSTTTTTTPTVPLTGAGNAN
jgi:hypothetical protein